MPEHPIYRRVDSNLSFTYCKSRVTQKSLDFLPMRCLLYLYLTIKSYVYVVVALLKGNLMIQFLQSLVLSFTLIRIIITCSLKLPDSLISSVTCHTLRLGFWVGIQVCFKKNFIFCTGCSYCSLVSCEAFYSHFLLPLLSLRTLRTSCMYMFFGLFIFLLATCDAFLLNLDIFDYLSSLLFSVILIFICNL